MVGLRDVSTSATTDPPLQRLQIGEFMQGERLWLGPTFSAGSGMWLVPGTVENLTGWVGTRLSTLTRLTPVFSPFVLRQQRVLGRGIQGLIRSISCWRVLRKTHR